jgi:NAD(P)-dependent dehydrogenase (short-subunit alcohol dehydrogenase family)
VYERRHTLTAPVNRVALVLAASDGLGRASVGVLALVAFLASEDAGYITGQSILVDGGMVRALP